MSLDATTWAWKLRGLRPAQKLVLLSMADRAGEHHTCHPAISRLTVDTGLDRKTVISSLQDLESAGLIRKTGRMTGYNNCVPEYALVGVNGREDAAPASVPVHASAPVVDMSQKRDRYQSQKRTCSENGPVPKTDNHLSQKRDRHQSQKRDTESPIESPKESSSFCPEPHEAHEPEAVVFTLPLKDGSDFAVTEAFVAELGPLYPRVDMAQAFKGMRGWLIGNPAKRKTRRGIKKFITGWLAREQEKGPHAVSAGGTSGGGYLPKLDKAVAFVKRYVASGEDAAAMVATFCRHERLDVETYEPAILAALKAA